MHWRGGGGGGGGGVCKDTAHDVYRTGGGGVGGVVGWGRNAVLGGVFRVRRYFLQAKSLN